MEADLKWSVGNTVHTNPLENLRKKKRINLCGFFLYNNSWLENTGRNDLLYKKKKDKTPKNVFHNNCSGAIWKKC